MLPDLGMVGRHFRPLIGTCSQSASSRRMSLPTLSEPQWAPET